MTKDEILAALRPYRFAVETDGLDEKCVPWSAIEKVLQQAFTVEPPPSRSVQRRVAAMKGEPAPTFEPTAGSGYMTWWQKLFTKVGIVESIDLTFGGAGNQDMKINGVVYATWIDYREWPQIGSRVRHKPYKERDGRGGELLATNILECSALRTT